MKIIKKTKRIMNYFNRVGNFCKFLICTFLLIAGLNVTTYGQYKSENLFYMVNSENSFQSFKNNIKQISIAAPQSFSMTKNGIVYGQVDPRIIKLAKENNVKVMPLVVSEGFDQQLMQSFLKDEEAQQRAIDIMVKLAKKHDFYGWQFDYEGMHFTDRRAYTEFYRKTAEALHKAGFKLSVAAIAYDSDFEFPTPYFEFWYKDWRGVYDFKALAEIGDFISLMAYPQHTITTPPGPVAGFPWVEEKIEYMLSLGIPPQKISLGLTFYSRHWYADYNKKQGAFINAETIGYQKAVDLIERNGAKKIWMEDQKSNYAYWSVGGIFQYLFFADSESLKAKLPLLKKYKLRGISVWRIGEEDSKSWKVIESDLVPLK